MRQTPVLRSEVLDRLVGCDLFLKAENLQLTGAFKLRGALAAVTARPIADRRQIVTASAGNFGQGVALAAAQHGLESLVLVPEGTPRLKVKRIRRFGGKVKVAGRSFDECEALARSLADRENLEFLPPFDHPRVIEGQGTLVLEMLSERPDLDALVVPCGGGGLLAGAAIVQAARRPGLRLIAAEPLRLPSLGHALRMEEPAQVPPSETVADGVAVRKLGALPYSLIHRSLAAVVAVEEEEILRAIRLLALETKQMVEGAGAIALAAVLQHPEWLTDCRRVGVLITGGNIDPEVFTRALGTA